MDKAIITSLNTDDPTVAMIMIAHNAAATLARASTGPERPAGMAMSYTDLFRQMYEALERTAQPDQGNTGEQEPPRSGRYGSP